MRERILELARGALVAIETNRLRIDDLNVYWTANDGTVQSVPLAGGAVTTIATGLNPCGLALDSTTVYWTDIGAGTVSKVAKP